MSAADPTSTSVIVPALNEDAIADVVSALRGAGAWHEIIVVDDGSTDGTGNAPPPRARSSSATPTTRATAPP